MRDNTTIASSQTYENSNVRDLDLLGKREYVFHLRSDLPSPVRYDVERLG